MKKLFLVTDTHPDNNSTVFVGLRVGESEEELRSRLINKELEIIEVNEVEGNRILVFDGVYFQDSGDAKLPEDFTKLFINLGKNPSGMSTIYDNGIPDNIATDSGLKLLEDKIKEMKQSESE